MGRHMGVFTCTMLKYGPLPPPQAPRPESPFSLTFSHFDQRWRHHRHGYIRHSIVHPRVCRVCRRIPDALGPWSRILTLRAPYLARIRNHVSPLWRREGLP